MFVGSPFTCKAIIGKLPNDFTIISKDSWYFECSSYVVQALSKKINTIIENSGDESITIPATSTGTRDILNEYLHSLTIPESFNAGQIKDIIFAASFLGLSELCSKIAEKAKSKVHKLIILFINKEEYMDALKDVVLNYRRIDVSELVGAPLELLEEILSQKITVTSYDKFFEGIKTLVDGDPSCAEILKYVNKDTLSKDNQIMFNELIKKYKMFEVVCEAMFADPKPYDNIVKSNSIVNSEELGLFKAYAEEMGEFIIRTRRVEMIASSEYSPATSRYNLNNPTLQPWCSLANDPCGWIGTDLKKLRIRLEKVFVHFECFDKKTRCIEVSPDDKDDLKEVKWVEVRAEWVEAGTDFYAVLSDITEPVRYVRVVCGSNLAGVSKLEYFGEVSEA